MSFRAAMGRFAVLTIGLGQLCRAGLPADMTASPSMPTIDASPRGRSELRSLPSRRLDGHYSRIIACFGCQRPSIRFIGQAVYHHVVIMGSADDGSREISPRREYLMPAERIDDYQKARRPRLLYYIF